MSDKTQSAPESGISIATLGTTVFAALFIASLEMIFVISFTALIYSGELTSQIPQALGFIILGDAILCLIVAFLSPMPGVIAVEQDAPGVMLSVAAAGVIATLSGTPEVQFATITLMIVVTTAMTGLILLFLGVFKLGGITRFLPYPIIGGFLAGSGWLLVQGAIGLMTNSSMSQAWLQGDMLRLWVPGVVLGIVIYYAAQKIDKPYTIPAIMLLATLLFYGLAWLGSSSLVHLKTQGWLLDTALSGSRWDFPLAGNILAHVDWLILLRQIPALLPVVLISVIGLLLNSSGLELIIKKDIDLNRALITAGVGNLAAGFTGGLAGFQDISFSSLNYTLSGGKRLVGILTAVLLGATLFFGNSALLYIPKFIFGSALVLLGFELLVEWIFKAWFKFSRSDFLVVVIIFGVIIWNGFLLGILVGLVLAVGIFAFNYSRVKVVKFTLTGREYHSRVTRAPQEQRVLEAYGDQIYILKLEGFVFFGTANGIFVQVRDAVAAASSRMVRYVVLDFATVSGIDSTGMLSFARMMQWSHEQGIILILTGLVGQTREQFLQESSPYLESGAVKFSVDLDYGLEWCENQIVAEHRNNEENMTSLAAHIAAIIKSDDSGRLLPYLQRREYVPGDYLIQGGDVSNLVYFIESGQVTAQIETPGKKPVRLETMYGGRTVGEVGFYLGTRRSASVVADKPSVVYSLSADDLKRMETNDPGAANVFHRMIVLLLSERVVHLSRTVGALDRT